MEKYKHEMKSFITKLNDRNIQRKRESGVTSYVLISVLILALYKVFSHSEFLLVNTVFSTENLNQSIWLICYTFNLLFSLGAIIYQLFPSKKNFTNLRLIKYVKTDSYVFLSMSLSFPIALILIIYTYYTNPNKNFIFNFYCIYIFLLNVFGLFVIYYLYKKNKEKELTIETNNSNVYKIIIFIFICLSIIIINLLSIRFIYDINIEYKIEIIKLTSLIYFCYVVIEKILETNSNDKYYSQLEDFEYEIILKDLDESQIRKEFQSRFSGFTTKDWISFQKIEFFNRRLTFEEDISILNQEIYEYERKKLSETLYNTKKHNETMINLLTQLFLARNKNQKDELLDMRNKIHDNIDPKDKLEIQLLIEEINQYETINFLTSKKVDF